MKNMSVILSIYRAPVMTGESLKTQEEQMM